MDRNISVPGLRIFSLTKKTVMFSGRRQFPTLPNNHHCNNHGMNSVNEEIYSRLLKSQQFYDFKKYIQFDLFHNSCKY